MKTVIHDLELMMNKLNLSHTKPTIHRVEKKDGSWQATTAWDLPGDRQLEIYTWRGTTTRMVETIAAVFTIKDENGEPCKLHRFGRIAGDYRHVIRRSQVLRLNEKTLLEQHQPAIEDLFDSVVDDVVRHYKLETTEA